ncbi:MAG: hypothetical protein ABIK28_20725, partial [Planctomycetota bacterium]
VHLIDRPPLPNFLANPRDACPFVLIGPGALDSQEAILATLKTMGCDILSTQSVKGYFELAWDLFGTHSGTVRRKETDLLSFNLDLHLYGDEADQCVICFINPPSSISLEVLRTRLKRKLGTTKFFRVRYQSLRDVCPGIRIHVPEESRIPLECHRLREHGVIAPTRSEKPLPESRFHRARAF